MSQAALKECLDAVACPTCGTKVILTKERILFCQGCCVGYPMSGDVPDLRVSRAINFKKMAVENKTGVWAQFQIEQGKSFKDSFEVKRGHCTVVGRSTRLDVDSDITYLGITESSVIRLNTHTLQLIDKFLSQSRKDDSKSDAMPYNPSQNLGGFQRDPDVFLDDRSVSRAHAVFFQDDEAVWVLDLVSKNGTYLNGREIERVRLKQGDMLSLGTVGIHVKLR